MRATVRGGADWEDCRQAARIRFWKRLASYSPERGEGLKFFGIVARSATLNELESQSRWARRATSLDARRGEDEDAITLYTQQAAPNAHAYADLEQANARHLLQRMRGELGHDAQAVIDALLTERCYDKRGQVHVPSVVKMTGLSDEEVRRALSEIWSLGTLWQSD